MTVITVPEAYNEDQLYVDLRPIFGHPLFLKCEGFNFAGSIKLKAAAEMVAAAEEDGLLTRDSVIVESSSGNLGVALSMIAASKGYRFLCVTDPRCNLSTRRLMEALGHLSPTERKQLAQLLSKWLDAAKISYTSPPMMGEPDEEVSGAEL